MDIVTEQNAVGQLSEKLAAWLESLPNIGGVQAETLFDDSFTTIGLWYGGVPISISLNVTE